MQYDPMSPIWLQVMVSIETDIMTGKLAPGSKLPGGRELAVTYAINPNTAARVYQELEKAGLCQTRRGLGTFVTEDEIRISVLRRETAQTALRQFLDRLAQLGISRQDAAKMMLEEEE